MPPEFVYSCALNVSKARGAILIVKWTERRGRMRSLRMRKVVRCVCVSVWGGLINKK